jgi:hypothetical protein
MGKKSSRPEKLSRARILKKYGLSLGTLDILNGTGVLESEFEHRRGKSFLPITKRDDFVLRCAKNEIHSFGGKGAIALPFHRFLILRMINTPSAEVYDEIFQLGLLPSEKHFKTKDFEQIRNAFILNAPEELKKIFEKGRDPRGKKEKNDLGLFLKVMSLSVYYDHSRLIDDLLFFLQARGTIEPLMTTRSKAEDIADALSKIIEVEVPVEAMVSYRLLFYSSHDITRRDMDKYLLMITPEDRRNKQDARKFTLTEFCVRRGVEKVIRTREVFEVIFLQAQRQLFNLSKIKTSEADQAARSVLDRVLKAHDALEAMGASSGKSRDDIAKMFDKFLVREVDEKEDGPVLTIHDIQKKGVGKVESGSE